MLQPLCFGVLWPSGLVHWTQVLALSECGFESRPGGLRRLCPWARHLTIIASSFRWDVNCRSRVLCNAHNRTQDTYRERERACPGVSGFAPWAPSRVDMCALQIFCIIIIIIIPWLPLLRFSIVAWSLATHHGFWLAPQNKGTDNWETANYRVGKLSW